MQILPFSTAGEITAALPAVTTHLKAGGLLAYPTETVYGFGSLLIPDALERLAALKGGRAEKAFLLLIRSPADLPELEWSRPAQVLAEHFWPGPLTLALPAPEGVLPARAYSGHTVAVRVSPHFGVSAILNAIGQPLTSTSANLPGQPPARSAEQVTDTLARTQQAVLVLDGGELPPSLPSSLVDCSADPPRLVREGVLSRETLRAVVDLESRNG